VLSIKLLYMFELIRLLVRNDPILKKWNDKNRKRWQGLCDSAVCPPL